MASVVTGRRQFIPRDYQQLMLGWALNVPRCALWAGMGLGKTSTALTVLDYMYLAGESRPSLVLAPKRVAYSTWPREAAKWDHLSGVEVAAVIGSEKERLVALKRDAAVKTINYDNLPWLVEHLGDRWPFGTVIADESTKLKSFRLRQGGQRAQALGRVAHSKVSRFIELTGTPSPNGLKDLWGQVWFLDAGQRLGRTYTSFIERWFRPTHDGYGVEPLPFAQEQIHDRLRDICLSLRSEDYFDVDKPIFNNIYVDLPSKAMRLYKDMEKEMFARIGGHDVEAFNAASRTIKCLQIANGAAYVDEQAAQWKEIHEAKIEALEDVIEEAAGAPVLVAYHFKSDLARLKRAFKDGIDVATPAGLEAAQQGKGRVWFGHPASMGHGIDGLQEHCNTLAFFGHWWDLEQYQQMIERIGPVRQAQAGHPRSVFVHHIVARGTVDELVMARRESKRSVQDLLLEAMRMRR